MPSRRKVSKRLVVGVMISLSGCVNSVRDDEETVTPEAKTSEDQNGSPGGTPDFSCNSYEPVAKLEFRVARGIEANLKITSVETGDTTVERKVAGGEEVVYDSLDGPFRRAESYDVNVRVNGSVRWNKTIRHTEEYKVEVNSDGNVNADLVAVVDSPTPCTS